MKHERANVQVRSSIIYFYTIYTEDGFYVGSETSRVLIPRGRTGQLFGLLQSYGVKCPNLSIIRNS